MLIQVIGAIPEDLLKEISPRSINLRRFAKVPLVMLLVEAAIQVGLDLIFFKFGQATLGHGTFSDNWPLITSMFVLGIFFATFNLHFVNLSVKYYD